MEYFYYVLFFAFGFIVGLNKNTDKETDNLKSQIKRFQKELVETQEKLALSKKWCKQIAEENAEFRRKQ